MALVTLDAIILQAFPYSETSRILRLLTATHGVQSVIAKGARRPRSRYGGVLEPFTDGFATFHFRDNRDLHTLSDFDLTRPRQGLGRDLMRFGGASLLAEIVLRTASEEAAPEVFTQVRSALDRLQDAPAPATEATALREAWALVTTLGFGPSLDRCVACGGDLPEAEDLFLDYAAGGLFCGRCHTGDGGGGSGSGGGGGGGGGGGRVIPVSARAQLLDMAAGRAVSLSRTEAHWQLLSRFLAFHLVDGTGLRSLDFLSVSRGAG
jgi:DNA repair protein RecO (recombination protein O)